MSPIIIKLKLLPPTTNAKVGKTSWYLQAIRKKYQKIISPQIAHLLPKVPYPRAKISYYRYSSSCPDFDGLVDSFKQIQDCLVNLGLIENDSMKNIGKPNYDWVQVPRGRGGIVIVVEPIIMLK